MKNRQKKGSCKNSNQISSRMFVSPPPPAEATVREWFVGIVLGNPELMRSISEKDRIAESIRIADEMVKALGKAKLPSADTLNISKEDLEKMSAELTRERELKQKRARETVPATSSTIHHKSSILPPPPIKKH